VLLRGQPEVVPIVDCKLVGQCRCGVSGASSSIMCLAEHACDGLQPFAPATWVDRRPPPGVTTVFPAQLPGWRSTGFPNALLCLSCASLPRHGIGPLEALCDHRRHARQLMENIPARRIAASRSAFAYGRFLLSLPRKGPVSLVKTQRTHDHWIAHVHTDLHSGGRASFKVTHAQQAESGFALPPACRLRFTMPCCSQPESTRVTVNNVVLFQLG